MSHGFRGCVKGLCLSAIYTASVYLCPAVRKKRLRGGSVPAGCREVGRHHYYNSNKISAYGLRSPSYEKAPLKPAALRLNYATASFIGRVFTSFPLNGGQAVFAVNETAAEYAAGKKINVKEKQAAPRYNKCAEVPRRTSLDILRVTLNLARGNIEDQSAATAAAS